MSNPRTLTGEESNLKAMETSKRSSQSKQKICTLQSLTRTETNIKRTSSKSPKKSPKKDNQPSESTTTRTKRALKEITNIPTPSPIRKKKKPSEHVLLGESKESEIEGRENREVREFRKSLSNSVIHSLEQSYERDNDISIITEVIAAVPSITFARDMIGTIGQKKFSSQFLERRAISAFDDFLSWLTFNETQRVTLQRVQFEKADIIMSSTELTLRIWFTRRNEIRKKSPRKNHLSRI